MNAVLTFQGFTESSRQRTGTEDLYFSVIRQFASRSTTTYQPQPWTADVKTLAAQIARQGIRNVAIVSYSHGQSTAVDFSKAAYSLGITVDLWLACDPVYRPAWLPRWNWMQPLAFRALTKTARIKVPHNIRRVTGVRQDISWPAGHDLTPTSPATYVEDLIKLPYSHTTIDHAPEWFSLVKTELASWITPPIASPA
jgi:hypothetical protein